MIPILWLFLTNARQQVTHYGSANQEFADASICRNEQKGSCSRRPLPSLLNPPPFSSSSKSPATFDACYHAMQAKRERPRQQKDNKTTRLNSALAIGSYFWGKGQ